MVDVAPATPGDLHDVVRVLTVAFDDDPVARWLRPRGRRLEPLFDVNVRLVHNAAGCTDFAREEGRPVGVGLWDPPGHRVGAARTAMSYLRFGAALRSRSLHGAALDMAFHRNRPPGTFWYLAQLGAAEQGGGVGTALLEHRLATITGPAYLESSNAANITLYERFGFRVTGEIRLPFGGPSCWPMFRD